VFAKHVQGPVFRIQSEALPKTSNRKSSDALKLLINQQLFKYYLKNAIFLIVCVFHSKSK
jgi:hypothetical protein